MDKDILLMVGGAIIALCLVALAVVIIT